MSDSAIIWVLIGVFLTLSYESLLRFIRPNNKVEELKNTKESAEVDAKNPDGTNKVKDETLFSSFPISEVKLVMVVREDLKMGKGKIGAQCGHATIGAYEQVVQYAKKSAYWKKVLNNWSWEGQKKVCVKVMSEQEL
jgi:peptidyl-tRNA hydrolase, PTH2 family